MRPGSPFTDWDSLLETAGSVGIKPAEFWDMTLREFSLYVRGYNEKTEREMDMLAWHAATTMNVHVKKGSSVKMHQLRPKRFRQEDPFAGMGAMERAEAALAMKEEQATAQWWEDNPEMSKYIDLEEDEG